MVFAALQPCAPKGYAKMRYDLLCDQRESTIDGIYNLVVAVISTRLTYRIDIFTALRVLHFGSCEKISDFSLVDKLYKEGYSYAMLLKIDTGRFRISGNDALIIQDKPGGSSSVLVIAC